MEHRSDIDIDLMSGDRKSFAVNIPVIASGGVGTLDHLVDGIKIRKCECSASSFNFSLWQIFSKTGKGIFGFKREFQLEFNMLKTLEDLIKIIRERKSSSDDSSYTSKLLKDKSLSLGKSQRKDW